MSSSSDSRTRVSFIYPPWITHANNFRTPLQNTLPPLGALSLAAVLEADGHHVCFTDVGAEGLDPEVLTRRVRDERPDFVGISVLTPMAVPALRIARIVKEELPDCAVVLGGVHAELFPNEMLRCGAVDVVVRGDGEEAMRQLVAGVAWSEIGGLSYRDGVEVVHNAARPLRMDLDVYPFPAYHLAPMDRYFPPIGTYKQLPALNMLMTRGCPGKCIFCNSAFTTLRTRSAERVADEIEYLHRDFGIRQIQFYDDTFTVMRRNAERFCEEMIARKLPVSWIAYVRSDCFNEKLAALMKRAGCHQVLVGVETGDDDIAQTLRKPIAKERTRRCVKTAQAAGLDVRASFIIGSPGETHETLERTLRFALELDAELTQWGISTPYPGTQLFEWAKAEGRLKTEEWSEYDLSSLLVELDGLSEQEVFDFERRAMRACYMRPRAIARRLRRVTRPRQLLELLHAFFVLILGLEHRRSAGAMGAWLEGGKRAQLDLDLIDGRPLPALTYELRQGFA